MANLNNPQICTYRLDANLSENHHSNIVKLFNSILITETALNNNFTEFAVLRAHAQTILAPNKASIATKSYRYSSIDVVKLHTLQLPRCYY